MVPFHSVVAMGLLYGAVLSLVMTVFIVATLLWRPMIWLDDAPAEVREVLGPASAADVRFKRIAGPAVMVFVGGLLVVALFHLARMSGGVLTFASAALLVFIIVMVFNVVDLVLIDWLLLVAWRPRFVLLPGVEALPPGVDPTGGYGYHFRGFLKGTAGSAVAALIIAAVAVVLF